MSLKSVVIVAFSLSLPAYAEIYKHVDADGHVTYSNVPTKGATKLDLEPLSVIPAPKPKATGAATPEGFPKVDSETQKKRDDTRQKLLEQELAAEQKLLAEAQAALKEGEAVRLGDEHNYQKKIDRVQKLKDDVTLHEKNIEALNRELAGSGK
jgi:hypothetical protein